MPSVVNPDILELVVSLSISVIRTIGCCSVRSASTCGAALDLLESKLDIADGFYKCRRKYIVNINQVHSFTSDEIIMRSGCRIPISRKCRAILRMRSFPSSLGTRIAYNGSYPACTQRIRLCKTSYSSTSSQRTVTRLAPPSVQVNRVRSYSLSVISCTS